MRLSIHSSRDAECCRTARCLIRRGQGWAVSLGIVSVSLVISDQMPWGVSRDRTKKLEDWTLDTPSSRNMEELKKEPQREVAKERQREVENDVPEAEAEVVSLRKE